MADKPTKPVRSQTVRAAALERDKWCTCCCGTQALEVHHIVAIADGGADDLDNVDVLCSGCHKEWHREAEGYVPYDDFLDAIPARMLARFLRVPEVAHLPVSEIQKLWQVVCMKKATKNLGAELEIGDRGEMRIRGAIAA